MAPPGEKAENTSDKDLKASDKDLRRSERNKSDKSQGKDGKSTDKDDLSLPPPLQVQERLAAKGKTSSATSTPKKVTFSDDEARLDRSIDQMERSIHEAETQLNELVHQKRIKGNQERLERLKQTLDKTKKKVKEAEEEGEKKEEELVMSDLRKNEKKKAHKTLSNLGLVSDTEDSSSESSESSESLEFLNQFETSNATKQKRHKNNASSSDSSSSDSSDDSDVSSKHKSRKKHSKKSKKSGMSKKASDKVKFPQTWPHSVLQYEFVSQNVQFKDLTFNMFVAGECEILTSKHISQKEFKGRLRLLKKIAYLTNIHDWKRVLQFYAAWVRRIEMSLSSWRDDSTIIENAMLFSKSFGKLLGRESSRTGQVWWCQDFNNNKCSVNSSSHQKNILGQTRLVQHICRTFWRIDKKQLQHPENSSACPHKH